MTVSDISKSFYNILTLLIISVWPYFKPFVGSIVTCMSVLFKMAKNVPILCIYFCIFFFSCFLVLPFSEKSRPCLHALEFALSVPRT